jgi:hypothetical protein
LLLFCDRHKKAETAENCIDAKARYLLLAFELWGHMLGHIFESKNKNLASMRFSGLYVNDSVPPK